ncbi:unnamed protein product [Prorocentrum cordatum]|uniref:Uncharacterized protein n=1 Tax=Prorocentrum cordatum TaxID=2364126 RepID=A0ABN9UEI3_9DINO|nr:unnamed protein product [Polarella glacialis]
MVAVVVSVVGVVVVVAVVVVVVIVVFTPCVAAITALRALSMAANLTKQVGMEPSSLRNAENQHVDQSEASGLQTEIAKVDGEQRTDGAERGSMEAPETTESKRGAEHSWRTFGQDCQASAHGLRALALCDGRHGLALEVGAAQLEQCFGATVAQVSVKGKIVVASAASDDEAKSGLVTTGLRDAMASKAALGKRRGKGPQLREGLAQRAEIDRPLQEKLADAIEATREARRLHAQVAGHLHSFLADALAWRAANLQSGRARDGAAARGKDRCAKARPRPQARLVDAGRPGAGGGEAGQTARGRGRADGTRAGLRAQALGRRAGSEDYATASGVSPSCRTARRVQRSSSVNATSWLARRNSTAAQFVAPDLGGSITIGVRGLLRMFMDCQLRRLKDPDCGCLRGRGARGGLCTLGRGHGHEAAGPRRPGH